MKQKFTTFALLLISGLSFSQEVLIQTRDNASITTAGTNSGFFQTYNPVNFPPTAKTNDWWYLLDTRHGDPRYAMQFSGGFSDQNLWFRKITAANTIQAWSKVLLEDPNGKVRIGGATGLSDNTNADRLSISGGHSNSSILLHANNDASAHAYLTLWASEPAVSYTNVGIGNNIKGNINDTPFQRIDTNRGGSYIRLLDNEMNFNVVNNSGVLNIPFSLNAWAASFNVGLSSSLSSSEGGNISLVNNSKSGHNVREWKIYNMTGAYGNSLQFWSYSDNSMGPKLKLTDEGDVVAMGNIITGGSNSWMFHTPDDGRKSLYFAPEISNGNYDWDHSVEFKNGNISLINGKLEAREVKVTNSPTADFVFEEDYALPSLESVEKHIKEKKHLPEISSAKEMEKEGVNVGEFQIKLLQKIEELTLYTIEQNKLLKEQSIKIKKLEERLESQSKNK